MGTVYDWKRSQFKPVCPHCKMAIGFIIEVHAISTLKDRAITALICSECKVIIGSPVISTVPKVKDKSLFEQVFGGHP